MLLPRGNGAGVSFHIPCQPELVWAVQQGFAHWEQVPWFCMTHWLIVFEFTVCRRKNQCRFKCQHFRFQTSSNLEAILGQWVHIARWPQKGSVCNTVGSQKDCTRSSDHKWSYQWCYNVSNCMLKTQFWCVRHLTCLTLRPQRQRRFCRDRFAFIHVGAASMTRQQSELSARTPRSSKDILRRKFQDLCISVPWCFAIIAQARLGVTNMVTSSLLTVNLMLLVLLKNHTVCPPLVGTTLNRSRNVKRRLFKCCTANVTYL